METVTRTSIQVGAAPAEDMIVVDVRKMKDALLLGREVSVGLADHASLTWQRVVAHGLRHQPYTCVANSNGQIVGLLPLALVNSWLFGRFLVSLPYVNSAGILTENERVAHALVDRACELASSLKAEHLQLRHEKEVKHSLLTESVRTKVIRRLDLPGTAEELWKSFTPKVRNQVRKGQKQELTVHWGQRELLGEFYGVFAHNMRDLGTPVYSKRLFASILREFEGDAELCVVRLQARPVAAAVLVHGNGTTEVPSASSLREHNRTNANMLMYWHLLQRAIERGQSIFDFGRSTEGSPTDKFKKQWGALPFRSVWQYYVRSGSIGDTRPDNSKYERAIETWKKLPVWLTRIIGPPIVRGIP